MSTRATVSRPPDGTSPTAAAAGRESGNNNGNGVDIPRGRSPSGDEEGAGSKRRRVRRACDCCKSRKRRCTGEQPCPACLGGDLTCTYDSKHGRGKGKQEEGVVFAEDHPQAAWSGAANHSQNRGPGGDYHTNANTSRAASPSGEGIIPSGLYHGPTSTFSFLRRAWRRFGVAEAVPEHQTESQQNSSVFVYGDRRPAPIDGVATLRLPDRKTTAALASRYFDFGMPTYRFLHRPTFMTWMEQYHKREEATEASRQPIREAIVLMALATACSYPADSGEAANDKTSNSEALHPGEKYYQAAQLRIADESGKASLQSVQARLATALYQLNTSRLNQAWYTLGTTFQLAVALGLHRSKAHANAAPDHIVLECQKRCFWAVYTLDTYLSVMLGRPPYINDTYVDQKYQEQVEDDDITSATILRRNLPRDCLEAAPVMHTKLMRIVKEASREQARLGHASVQQQIDTARRLTAEVDQWKERLPLFLSGGIHPSSLIPVFRRQLNVLQLGCAHALMIINRPLVLSQRADPMAIQPHVEKCVSSARFVLETVMDLVADHYMFPSFWTTQYVTFNALSMVYVWIMQRKRGRLSAVRSQSSEAELLTLADTVQSHLARVTLTNAPTLRYSIILEELQREARGALMRSDGIGTVGENHGTSGIATGVDDLSYGDSDLMSMDHPSSGWSAVDLGFDPELWLQLDNLPFSNFDN